MFQKHCHDATQFVVGYFHQRRLSPTMVDQADPKQSYNETHGHASNLNDQILKMVIETLKYGADYLS